MKHRSRNDVRGSEKKRHRGARFPREIAILYEDDSVLAVNKPAGLVSVPVPGSDTASALSVVSTELRKRKQKAFTVHRIDRFASGILLFAKTAADRDALVRQFLEHTPVREYLVIVRGHPAKPEGTLVHHFRREGMFQKLTGERDRRAARAELRYKLEKQLRGASLVRVALTTGLQNQIRVQFAAIGHPVIGDRKYSPEEAEERRIARVALHAAKLDFQHPRTGKTVALVSDPPADFRALVNSLS